MKYEPSLELLASMDFGELMNETYGWMHKPMLLYLGSGRLMNKTTNEIVTLKATNDREFLGELVAHGWTPAHNA
jgi:hypothetical protein